MLRQVPIKIYRRIRFILKFSLIRLLYFREIKISSLYRTFLGRGFDINISSGQFMIGRYFHARQRLSIVLGGGEIIIGDNIFVNNDVSINCHEKIVIGSNSLIGEGVKFYDHNHCFKEPMLISRQGFKTSPIIVHDNVWIGSNVIILKGVTIGANSVISAGTIVREDVPPDCVLTHEGIMKIRRR